MSRFRPSAISTVALVAVGWGLCSLGFWQVDRWRVMSEQKRAFDHEIEKPPVQVQGLRQAGHGGAVASRGEWLGATSAARGGSSTNTLIASPVSGWQRLSFERRHPHRGDAGLGTRDRVGC